MSEISENKPEIEIIENNNSEKTETQTKIEESTVDELADSNPKNIDDENSSETSPLPQGVLEKETEKNDNQDDEVQEEDTLEAENDITLEDENVVTEEKNEIEIMENDVVLKTPGKSDGNQGLDENEEKNKKSPSSSASSVVSLSTSNPEKSRNTPIPSSACMDNPVPKTLSKHRLQDTWTLWFMDGDKNKRNDKPKDWRENLTPLYTFNTVEDFWILYSHILNPSKLRVKNDYMLFKEGIKPEWEDPGNKAGGKWQLVLPNKFRQDLLDKCWLKTILSIIAGHYHDLGKYICGAYLQRRQKEDRISLWTSQKDLKLENETIGKQLKKTLAFDSKSELHYLKHEDQKPEGSNQNRSWKNRNQQNARLYVV